MKLRTKILLLFLLISLLPVCATGYLSYRISRKAIEQEAISFLVATNLQKSTRVKHWIADASRQLEFIAGMPILKEQFSRIIHEYDQPDEVHRAYHHELMSNLLPAIARGAFIELFILRPADGLVLASTDSLQEGKIKIDREYFIEGQKGTYIENTFYSMTIQLPTMVISTPIKDTGGHPVAVLVGRLNLQDLSVIMEERSGLRATEDTYLVNTQNYFITEPRFRKGYALRNTVHTKGVIFALQGQQGTAMYNDYRDVPVLGAYQYLPERKLALISEIDQQEYLAPIERLQKNIFGIGGLIALVSLLIGWKSAETLLQPLLRLVAAVNRTGADNLVFTETIPGKDEISQLGKAFSAMMGRLQQTLVSRDTLQQEVEMRRNTEVRLKNALVQLGRSNKELEQFAYVASHDLQEPLRMVSSFVQLLGDRYRNQLDDKARKYIHYAVDGAARMQILIQELLAFSRVSTRGLDFERINALTLLAQAEDNLKVAIAESAARITHDRLPMVLGDKAQLVQVFQNLIGNAIKFCKDGPPIISIGAEKQGDMWQFSIRDNGIGIDRQYAEKIFVIFQRLHTREEYPGTGIGLSLCKRIVERHGGTIWFESEVGKGTTFFFTLLDQDATRQNETEPSIEYEKGALHDGQHNKNG